MKNLICYIIVFNFFSSKLTAQCQCAMQVEIEQLGNCCYDLRFCNASLAGGCPPVYDQIEFSSNSLPASAASIVSINPGPGIAVVQNGAFGATFSSPVPLNISTNDCAMASQFQLIGTVCLDNPLQADVVLQTGITGSSGSPCGPMLENFTVPCSLLPPSILHFDKLYGDAAENLPTKVKSFGDGMYVAGTQDVAGVKHATFSKYDLATGALVWDFVLAEGSIFHDFEYVPASDEFLLIGATEPFQVAGISQDNESLLVRVDDLGNLVFARRYQQLGREHFNRIIRHPNPRDPDFPYYVVGTKNPPENPPFYPPPPSATDRVFALCINENGGVLWANEYDYDGTNVPDDEFHRGLFAVNATPIPGVPPNGDIVIMGNDAPVNNGILVKLDGGNGNVLKALRYDGSLDLYDGVELSGGQIALVGEDFGNHMAFMSIVDHDFVNIHGGRFENIRQFREVGLASDGRLYACGHANGSLLPYPIVHRILNGPTLILEYGRYLFDSETEFKDCRFSVTPAADAIFYADARVNSNSGFGNFDLLVANMDLDFAMECKEELMKAPAPFSLVEHLISVTATPMTLPTPGTVIAVALDYACNDFCSQTGCTADFEWQSSNQGCFEIHFIAQSEAGNTPTSYCWDFDGTAGCDNSQDEFFLAFPACGNYDVCLTITYADGCTATHCEEVSVTDFVPPIFVECPGNITVDTDPGTCHACLNPLIIAVDNCTMLPNLSCNLTGSSTGVIPSTCYELGTTTVTCLAIDDCGNASLPCVFNVTVVDNEPPGCPLPPGTVIFNTDPGFCTSDQNVLLTIPFDNCDSHPTAICTRSDGLPIIAPFPKGLTNIVCITTDASGNQNTCQTAVDVKDVQPPMAICKGSLTILLNSSGVATLTPANVDDGSTDNCAIIAMDLAPNTFTCAEACHGPIPVTLTVTDCEGTTATCTSQILVIDGEPPKITCPGGYIGDCGDGYDPSVTGFPTGTDNCDPPNPLSFQYEDIEFALCDDPGIVRQWVAFDACGNASLPCIQEITIIDNVVPVISCPGNLTVSTDPGVCHACFNPPIPVVDNCDANPVFTCTLSGATIGDDPNICYEKGLTMVTCTATDACGNESLPCTFTVEVEDTELPTINCPDDINVHVPGCTAGEFVDFADPEVDDNCQIVSVVCNPPSGSFFDCGQNIVTCTATDDSGNTNSCAFNVRVIGCNSCAKLLDQTASCTSDPGVYDYVIHFENLTTLPFNSASVSATADLPAVFCTPPAWSGDGTLSGCISFADPCPWPLGMTVNVSFSFPCSLGVIECTIPVEITTPCCDMLTVPDVLVCKNDGVATIPLIGPDCILENVTKVTWYLAEGNPDDPDNPCGLPSPYQSYLGPFVDWAEVNLPILTGYFVGIEDMCVYAEVKLIDDPCAPTLPSNTAHIKVCDLPSGHILNGADAYCSISVPSPVPDLVFQNNEPDCPVLAYQWFDHTGALTGETSATFSPGSLFYGDPAAAFTDDCWTEYRYKVAVTNQCGTNEFEGSVRIYNDDAPAGTLSAVYPTSSMPFCPGQDVIVCYEPACVGPNPEEWEWSEKTVGGTYTPLSPGAGNTNPKYYTNQLEQDTWYKVKKVNGTCPEDEVELLVDISGDLDILDFSAIEDDPCNPGNVSMTLNFSGDCSNFTVRWYKDGDLIGTTNNSSSPVPFDYLVPPLDGNYYAIIEDACCQKEIKTEVIVIAEPCFAVIEAPCFRCNDEPIVLTGHVFGLPDGATCTYQWYKNNIPIPGGDDQSILVNQGDALYTFTANCGCVKSVDYYLLQCGDPVACECSTLSADVGAGFAYEKIEADSFAFWPAAPLADCNEVTWAWGDGSSQTLSIGSNKVFHTFPGSGSYDICMEVKRQPGVGAACNEDYCDALMVTPSGEAVNISAIRIYPNPSNGHFTIYFNGSVPREGTLQVMNEEGKVLLDLKVQPDKWHYPVAIAGMPAGVYVIKLLENGTTVWARKIVNL